MSKAGKQNILGLTTIAGMLVLIAASLLLPLTPSVAQQSSTASSVTPVHAPVQGNGANNVIDGRDHPELIKDKDAYRLFFLAATANQDPAQRQAMFGPLKLTPDQLSQIGFVLNDLRLRHDQMISDYNAGVMAQQGQMGDLKSFLGSRDALVAQARASIENIIGVKTFDLYSIIQIEKRNMVVAVADSQFN